MFQVNRNSRLSGSPVVVVGDNSQCVKAATLDPGVPQDQQPILHRHVRPLADVRPCQWILSDTVLDYVVV